MSKRAKKKFSAYFNDKILFKKISKLMLKNAENPKMGQKIDWQQTIFF